MSCRPQKNSTGQNATTSRNVPGRVSGAWVIKGTRVPADAIVENARAGCTAEEIAGPDIFPSIPLDVVHRVLRFAKITPPSNG